MSKADDFDKFLIGNFEKNKSNIADEGFTERVTSNLLTDRNFPIDRKFILYLSSALSVFIFFISQAYKTLFSSINDIFNSGFYWLKPSLVSFFVIFVFISVSFIISRIEYDEDLI